MRWLLEKISFARAIDEEQDYKDYVLESEASSQSNPKRFYVYAHLEESGKAFYIGKGTGRRAWSRDRHALWHRYVERHLKDKYAVKILVDDLSSDESEEIENSLIKRHGIELVNWFNDRRSTNFETSIKFHKLRDANRAFIEESRALEKTRPQAAIDNYMRAIEFIKDYAFLELEGADCLVGKLLKEESEEIGYKGEIVALDRITLCLSRTGQYQKARQITESYFKQYRGDLQSSAGQKALKRVNKMPR